MQNCEIVLREFELQSRYYVHFRTNALAKGMNPFILPALNWIVPLLFYKDGYGIKLPRKVGVSFNQTEATKICILIIFMLYSFSFFFFFLVHRQNPCICLSFWFSLIFTGVCKWNSKIHLLTNSFLGNYHKIWSSDGVIRLYLKVSEKFLRLIFGADSRLWIYHLSERRFQLSYDHLYGRKVRNGTQRISSQFETFFFPS